MGRELTVEEIRDAATHLRHSAQSTDGVGTGVLTLVEDLAIFG